MSEKKLIKKIDAPAKIPIKFIDNENLAGSDQDSDGKGGFKNKMALKFDTSQGYTSKLQKSSHNSDSDGVRDLPQVTKKYSHGSNSYSSSVGSTKDRDNSNSSSAKSNTDGDSQGKIKMGEPVPPELNRAYFQDNVEDKTYKLNATGTMVDVTRRRKKMRKIPMSVKKPVSQYVGFIKSPFKNRPPLMFFPYPSYVNEKKEEYGRVFFKPQEDLGPLTMRFKISENTNIYNAMVNACKTAGMYLVGERKMLKSKRIAQGLTDSESSDEEEEENPNNYNLLFSGAVKDDIIKSIKSYQKINHFPKSFNLGRKDAMWRNYQILEEQFPDDYDFCPKTFIFPEDADVLEAERTDPDYDPETDLKLWIFKPSASSCGKGIKIVTRDDPIPTSKKGFVISEYVANPHLIEGLKYDLRVYVLVASYDPLIVFLYDDGLARFATDKYTLDEEQFENRFVHLTNYSVQKNAEGYTQNKTKAHSNLRASKWSLKTLQRVFEDHGKDYKSVKRQMKDLIIKTIISVEPPIMDAVKESCKNPRICYELYGFDIIIDSNLKPWILEVNISPSFSSSSPFDKTLKTKLICDTLTLVGIKPTNHEKYEREEKNKIRTSDALGHKVDDEETKTSKNIDDIGSKALDQEDYDLLLDFEEQIRKNENFELIFPVKKNFKKYIKFFQEKRYNNYLLWNHLKEPLIDIESLYV